MPAADSAAAPSPAVDGSVEPCPAAEETNEEAAAVPAPGDVMPTAEAALEADATSMVIDEAKETVPAPAAAADAASLSAAIDEAMPDAPAVAEQGRSGSGADSDCSSNSSDSDGPDGVDGEESELSEEEEVDGEVENPSLLKDLMLDELPTFDDQSYRGDWSGAPEQGTQGFSDLAATVMRAAGVASAPLKASFDTSVPCPPRQPHQDAAVFLMHPKSPVSRLLVDHPTGSGKTREMIEILDNYFFDPRPKIPIFPKEPVCQNFYAELLRWPSRYRDFFCCLRPEEAALAAGISKDASADWRSKRNHLWDLGKHSEEDLRHLCRELRAVLEMKGYFYMGRMRRSLRAAFAERFPGEHIPAGPLRALRYTSAGGGHTKLRDADGLPASALLKIGFDRGGVDKNVYSNKVVLMDEVHNLVRSQTVFGEQLATLRELLRGAKGAVVAGFTGTPILGEPCEGRQLLDIIKGTDAEARGAGDEGFVSSFQVRPAPLFPVSLPRGVPDAILTPNLRRALVKKVDLCGEALQRYEVKRAKGLSDQRLKGYCNMSVYFGSFHEGRSGTRAHVLANFESCAPKLYAIAKDVAAEPTKALVLVARNTGMGAFLAHLREVAEKSDPPFGVATMDELATFNSAENLRGGIFRVMVADAMQCSEGVSFFAVRRLMLADVPLNPSALVQSVGRAIRMYGHRGLPVEEQTVTTTLYVASFPARLRGPLGAWAYRAYAMKREDPMDGNRKAKRFLRSLHRAGIRTLEDLKSRLDAFVRREQRAAPSKAARAAGEAVGPPALADAPGFLESIGLWDEARSVRNSQEKRPAKPKPGPKAPSKAPAEQSTSGSSKRHYLARALHTLSTVGQTATDVVLALNLSPTTADEEILRLLAARSRILVPALAELRSNAADRAVLGDLVASQAAEAGAEEDEGESSAYEFAIDNVSSDGEGSDEEQARRRDTPLVLPPDWQVRRFKREHKGGVYGGREFVDGSGAVYRTMSQAKRVVDQMRRTANMSSKLEERFGARLRAQREAQEKLAAQAAAASEASPSSLSASAGDTASTSVGSSIDPSIDGVASSSGHEEPAEVASQTSAASGDGAASENAQDSSGR